MVLKLHYILHWRFAVNGLHVRNFCDELCFVVIVLSS